jgi:hypothetical protein
MQNILNVKIYKIIILPVVLCGYVTLSLTLREENRLRMFENRVMRKIFGPNGNEVIEGWKKLRNEELHNLYCLSHIIGTIKPRRMRWTEYVVGIGVNSLT